MADVISFGLSALFLVLLVIAFMNGMRGATLRQLTRAMRLQLAATAVAAVSVGVHAWSHEEWWMFLIDGVKMLCPLITFHFLARRRESQGVQAVFEAERIVRNSQRDRSL